MRSWRLGKQGLAAAVFVTAAIGAGPVGAGQAPREAVIDIDGGAGAPRVAVPDCVPRSGDQASREACAVITRVLRDDLEFEGLFRLLEPSLYAEAGPLNPQNPDFEAWRSLFASFLVVTRAGVTGDQLAVDVRVWNLDAGRNILEKRYSGSARNPRFFGHTVSDEVMELANSEGVARTQIAFTSDRDGDFRTKEIYVADFDGQRVRRLTQDDSISILPDWSPSGDALAYTSYVSRIPSVIVEYPYGGGSPLNLTQGQGQAFAPAWSADGERIAFSLSSGGRVKLWVVNANGSGLRQLTEGPGEDTAPSWSPTGREIAFTSNRSGSPQIWVVGAEGLNLRRLSRVGSYNDAPAWSPSKTHSEIAYTSRLERGQFDIAVIDLSSGQVRQITTGRGSCEKPSWAPSGRHLIFACQVGGQWRLAQTDRLGQRMRTLSVGSGNNAQPAWGPFRQAR
jgi:TolB protein